MKAIVSTLLLVAVFGIATVASAQDAAVKTEAKAEVKADATPAEATAAANPKAEAKPAEAKPAATAPAETAPAAAAPEAAAPAEASPAAAAPAPAAPPAIEVVATSDVPASSESEEEAITARGSSLSSFVFGLDLGLAGAVLGLHIGAALTYEPDDGKFGEEPVPYALWGAALSTTAFMGPLSYYLGSKLIRQHNPGVEGSLGMRMLGWISFFLYMDLGVTGVVLGLTDGMKGTEGGVAFIGVTAVLGVMSYVGFAMEALICKKQANKMMNESASLRSRRRVALAPLVAPVYTDTSASGATFGVSGTF